MLNGDAHRSCLVVCLTVIPAAAIFAIFLTQSRADLENVNVNVRVAPQAPSNYGVPVVMPPLATMPTPPKHGSSPRGSEPAGQKLAAPGQNSNATPTPTPSPTPPRPFG